MNHTMTRFLSFTALAFLCVASTARADVKAKVLIPGSDQTINAEVRWMPVDKQYVVTRRGQGGQISEQNYSADEIRLVQVQPPQNWEQVLKAAKANPASAIPALKKIASDYKMLMWDAQAGMIIGQIYLKQGQAEKALAEMAPIMMANAEAGWNSPMAPVLWKAMIDSKKTKQLGSLLEKAAGATDRKLAAQAMIYRGDLIESEGRTRDALRDGYLRAVFLFADQTALQPEALYKAAQAFDKLRQTPYAERMRSQLRKSYGSSTWARKLDGGN